MIGRSQKFFSTGLLIQGAVCVAMVGTVFAQSPPGGLTQMPDGHWTAWNPPTPAEGSTVHVVQEGETLSTIAAETLGNGGLWPQIWEANQYILDAHWIYPGDPLVIPAAFVAGAPSGDVMADTLGEAQNNLDELTAAAGEPSSGSDSDPFADLLQGESGGPGEGWDPSFAHRPTPEPPQALGHEADIYCSGYIGALEEEFPYSIASSEYEFLTPSITALKGQEMQGLWGKGDTQKYGLESGDIVYLDGGRADGLSPGELLTAILPRDKVRHPATDKVIGRLYSYMGRVRVLSVQEETGIGEIVRTCDPIPVGTQLRIFEPEPVPLRSNSPIRPVNFPAANDELEDAPIIIASVDNIISLAAGYLVYVDKGEDQDVLPGDIFTVYRKGRRGYPPIVVGEVGILSVQNDTSLGRILRSRRTVFVGDAMVIK